MTWSLQGPLDGTDPNQLHPIRVSVTVGRNDSADLCVQRSAVSGSHARLDVDGDRLFIADTGSRNGTFVNGVPVTESTAVAAGDLVQFADVVFRVVQRADTPRLGTVMVTGADVAKPLIGFEDLLASRDVVAFFQPIVDATTGECLMYELLGRSRVPGLENPGQLFRAATMLQREVELSELFREVGAESARSLPAGQVLMNSHPAESEDWRRMAERMIDLRDRHPDLRLMLEIHEKTVTDPDVMTELRAILADHDIGLAYDDFGAGQARLQELLDVPPDILKFDIGLIRGLDVGPPARARMVRSLVDMVRELGITVLAEGVETEGESEACVACGFELLQGFFHGRPGPVEHWTAQ